MIEQNLEVLAQEIEVVQQRMNDFRIDKNTSYAYFLGITGSGKSTTINFMLTENMLKFEKQRGKFSIINPEGKFPSIGNTNKSCTVIPELFNDPKTDLVYVDPPGFMDTGGPHQQTINSYSNARMFQRGTQTKIVLVVQHAALLAGRGNAFPQVAKRLFNLFPRDFDRLTHSMMILITKVSLADLEEQDVITEVKDITRQNMNMGIECKAMIQGIIQEGNIFMMPSPTYLKVEHIHKVKKGLTSLRSTMLSSNATISLSYQAKSMLEDLSNIIVSEINQCSKRIRNQIEMKFLNTVLKTVEEYDNVIRKLKGALNILMNQSDSGFDFSFTSFAQQIDLNESISERVLSRMRKMQFCKTLHSEVRPNLSLIDSISNCLRQMIGTLEAQVMKLATKQEMQEMNRKHEQQISQRNKEFKQFNMKLEADGKRRQEQSRNQLAKQGQMFQRMMDQSSKNHAESIRIIQQEMKALRNKPPQIIHQQKRGCSIM